MSHPHPELGPPPPLADATAAQVEQLRTDLVAGGVKLPGGAA